MGHRPRAPPRPRSRPKFSANALLFRQDRRIQILPCSMSMLATRSKMHLDRALRDQGLR